MDVTHTLLSTLIGGLGFVLFIYGKKTTNWKPMVAGVFLSILPFLANSKLTLIAGSLITFGSLYVFRD